jgi:hypothetical protein
MTAVSVRQRRDNVIVLCNCLRVRLVCEFCLVFNLDSPLADFLDFVDGDDSAVVRQQRLFDLDLLPLSLIF